MTLARGCAIAGAAFALVACTLLPPATDVAVRHRYVVLGPGGVPVARAITTAAACPAIEFDGVTQPMAVRVPAATIPLRPTRSTPAESKPSAFPVLTCERVLPTGTARAVIAGVALPLPKPDPRRMVVVGDTGCRVKRAENIFQRCDDPASWPFARIANAAAALAPDLVLHVGDYHYRENACPPGNAGCAGTPWGYGYDTWDADLFAPAAALLAAAPWIVIRGNHESCDRAGQGWWRFLDPRPLAARQDCNDPNDDGVGDFSAPYAVPLGADAQVVVFDSSLAPVTPLSADQPMFRTYRAQFEQAFAITTQRPQTLFVNHHPILGFATNPANADVPYPGNAALHSALSAVPPGLAFPMEVQALIAGHNHMLEVVSFASGQPPQVIAGHGGDWLDPPLKLPLRAGTAPAPGAVVASIVASDRFGFGVLERVGAGWTLKAFDVEGRPIGACTIVSRVARCSPDPFS